MQALASANSLLRVARSSAVVLEVLLVDDGSGDDTAGRIAAELPPGARLIRLERNLGRSGARNAGATQASGELLLFTDSDCVPADASFIKSHLRRFDADVVASTGPVVGTGRGFWHDFQVRSSARRATLHGRSITYSGSTQNLMVRRDCFKAIGGFDQGYRAYGFEDRDLLIRLGQLGSIVWTDEAVVEHHDDLELATVCRKMREAGVGGAAIFSAHHPEAYRALGYAAVDAHQHPARARMVWVCSPLLPIAIAAVSVMLEWRSLPFGLRCLAVRALSGASFLLGTADAEDRSDR